MNNYKTRIQKGLTPLQLPHFSSGRQRLIGRSRTLDMIVSPSVSMPDVVQNIGVTVNEDQNRSACVPVSESVRTSSPVAV